MNASLPDNSGPPVPTLPQAINSAAIAHPDRIAIIDDFRAVTWAELLAECVEMFAFLKDRNVSRLGVATGNEIGHLVAIIAAAAAQIPAVPVANDWTSEDIARRFVLTGVELVLCSQSDERRLRKHLPMRLVSSKRANSPQPGSSKVTASRPAIDEIHLIAPTGGTSGQLKFAHLSHANTVSQFITQIVEFGLVRRGRFLCATPLFHGGGRSFSLCHLYIGGSVLLRQQLTAGAGSPTFGNVPQLSWCRRWPIGSLTPPRNEFRPRHV